jgi:trk system potassium uptake protein TrkA
MEVLAVDSSESLIASIRDKVTQAVCTRITDEETLLSIGADEMDTVIVAMGENFAQSILITAILKKRLKVKNVVARSISEIHKDILKIIGANHVILPEKEVGKRLADRLSLPFMPLIHITEHFSISQVDAPRKYIGRTVDESNFFDKYSLRCIGIKSGDNIISVSNDYVIQDDDILVISGSNKDITRFIRQ